MLVCVVAAGEMRCRAFWEKTLQRAEIVICANGGTAHCQTLGTRPDLIVGDLDSLEKGGTEFFSGVEILRHPQDKDRSDCELAVEQAFLRQPGEVWLLGGSGSRLDHLFANEKLLCRYPGRLKMVDGDFEIVAIANCFSFEGKIGERCSLLPVTAVEKGMGQPISVSAKGLKYPLNHLPLAAESQGLSNLLVEPKVSIEVHSGLVLLFRVWEPGSDRQPLTS